MRCQGRCTLFPMPNAQYSKNCLPATFVDCPCKNGYLKQGNYCVTEAYYLNKRQTPSGPVRAPASTTNQKNRGTFSQVDASTKTESVVEDLDRNAKSKEEGGIEDRVKEEDVGKMKPDN